MSREARRKAEYKWRQANPDKVKEMNVKACAKYAKLNKGLKNYHSARRRAKLRHATPTYANQEKIKEFYLEAARISEDTGIPHEVDHIYPLQGELICGLHIETNLQILPREENRSKHNR